jgi:microcystin-dependent protein
MTTSSKRFFWELLTVIAMAITVTIPFDQPAEACGSEPFLGEICLFSFTFCPTGYAETNGQLLPINQNEALYSIIGTTYGGDGQISFALPDLRGRTALHVGRGAGLSEIVLGEVSGAENVTLSVNQIPSHSHSATTSVDVTATLRGTNSPATDKMPGGNVLAATNKNIKVYSTGSANVAMGGSSIMTAASASTSVGSTGGTQSFGNRSPFLGLRYCIAIQGIFPSTQ